MGMIEKQLNVEGMHCQQCAETIINMVGDLDGVQAVEPDYEVGTVKVKFDSDKVDIDQIAQEIRAAGYEPTEALD